MAGTDDGSIANEHDLLRRIRPDQIVDDQNLGVRRPSSAAFKDPHLSSDCEQILIQNGLDWRFSLQGFNGYSLVRLKASAARAMSLPVIHNPIDGNPAHVEVHGKKTQGVAKSLVSASEWAHLEP